jgi:hypothetical protein
VVYVPREYDLPAMVDFYFEKTRDTVDQYWPESFTSDDVAKVLGVERVPYRIYYSKDDLTLRLFVFRPHCTYHEEQNMLDMGFVVAKPGDAELVGDDCAAAIRARGQT